MHFKKQSLSGVLAVRCERGDTDRETASKLCIE
jgi:hypothetical protein